MKNYYFIIAVVLLCVLCFILGRYTKKVEILERITVDYRVDTLRMSIPQPITEVDIETIEVPFPIVIKGDNDTIKSVDTVLVYVPLSRKTYETDEYKAVIKGYKPELESLTIYRKKEIVNIKDRRLGIGVIAGYGVGKNGLSPYIGLGGFYRIF